MWKSVVSLCLVAVLVGYLFMSTNPAVDDFDVWYKCHVEIDIEDEIYNKIDSKRQVSDGVAQLLIDGVWEVFVQDEVDKSVDAYLLSVREHVIIDKKLFWTNYEISMPDGSMLFVCGYLNSFHKVDVGL